MPIQWTSTSQINLRQSVKICVHAESGCGKTMLCATAPKPVVISAEGGLRSLNRANIERVYGVGRSDITYELPVLEVSNIMQLEEVYQLFANPVNHMEDHCSSLCLDSITEVAEKMLQAMKAGTKDPRQAYGEMADRTLEYFRKFRDLNLYHCYMSAQQEQRADAADGISRYTVSMPGKQVGPKVPYMFDEVFHLGISKTQDGRKFRYLRTDQDLQYVAKDRSGRLDEIEEPHLGKIIAKITGATNS